jgi:YD repeat-containing protein
MIGTPAHVVRKRFAETIRLRPRSCYRLPLKKSRSPRPLCITSYAYRSILKNALANTYDTAGQLTQINDKSLGQTTRYTYDLAGKRLRKQLWQKTLLAGTDAQTDVLYQDNHLAYDALNRLRVAGNNECPVHMTASLAPSDDGRFFKAIRRHARRVGHSGP